MTTAREAVLWSYWRHSRAMLHPSALAKVESPVCLALIALLDDERLARAAQRTLDLADTR